MTPRRPPLSVAFERLGVDPDLADYFFKLHAEIEPFEQDEGWEYVPTVLHERPAAPRASSAPTSRRSSPSAARTKACSGA